MIDTEKKKTELHILFVSSEVTPYAKTGGLADVSASLPAALADMDYRVTVVMPFYRSVQKGSFSLRRFGDSLSVPHGGGWVKDDIYCLDQKPNLTICFIKNDDFFDRDMLYGTPKGDYPDNADRFIYFSRAVLELTKLTGFRPDIIHCNDWQTGLIPVYLKTLYKDDPFFTQTRSLFTIHNLAYQGVFPKEYLGVSGLPGAVFTIDGVEYYDQMNFMKGGIVFSDLITTVSGKYAEEIQTPEFGHGLEGVLRNRRRYLHGVLNGVEDKDWNPRTDALIAARYDTRNITGKSACRRDLLSLYRLKAGKRVPIIGMISRLASQKGFDILLDALEELCSMDLRLVLLGTGDETYERQFTKAASKYRKRMGIKIAFDNVLAHKIEAGSDMFLMPSRYEPCGLNQMYSLKYGSIPIVRATGGLDDTITDFDPESRRGNGFKFVEYTALALVAAVKKALDVYQDRDLWFNLMKNAMESDFSWKRSAGRYAELYQQAVSRPPFEVDV